MAYRNVLLFLHILFAITVLGPLVASGVAMSSIVRRGPVALPVVRWLHAAEEMLGRLTILILLTGILLVLREDVYGFDQAWIAGAIVLFVAAIVNGAVFMNAALKSAITKLETGQAPDAEVARLRVLGTIAFAIVVAILWLMIDKPGLG